MRLTLAASLSLLLAAAPLSRAAAITPVPAPSWKLVDVDGKTVTSDQFKGKVVVIDFWATWCPPCKAEIPGYVALQKKYADSGVVIVGVSKDDEGPGRPALVKKFMESRGINYTIVYSSDEIEAALGGIDAIPTTFIIGRDGKIHNKKVGAEPTEDFEKELVGVLKPAP
jgi:thiol-disulfide isomerase/thioredoxin